MMTKQEMIDKIRDYYGLKKNIDFAAFFGISEKNAHMWQKNGRLDFEEFWKRCPEISPDWMLSGGEGPMLRSERGDNFIPATGFAASQPLVTESEALRTLAEALKHEQEALAKAQEHISGLIEALNRK